MEEEYEYEMRLTCDSLIVDGESYKYCSKKARWIAEWSDRRMILCDEHRSEAKDVYDMDHEYDQTGLVWTRIIYHDEED